MKEAPKRLNIYLSPEMSKRISSFSREKNLRKTSIVDMALQNFFSPESADQREAAISRRLDRLSRHTQRLERNIAISTEALALYVKFWLTVTPDLSPDAHSSAQLKGKEKYEAFLEALGGRIKKGRLLVNEIPQDVFETGVSSQKSGEEV
jgi:hypothetical protein